MGSRVSVVVTCHNYGRYLRECLESVLEQDRPADEIIVVDDASTDNTPAIAAEYAPFGVRYERVDFRDACLSYNHGITIATGDLLAYVDADNALTPRFIATLAARLDADPHLAFAYSDRRWLGEAPVAAWEEIGARPGDIGRSYPPDPAMLVHRNFIDTMAIVRRSVAIELGGFRTLPALWDYRFWVTVLEAGYGGGYVAEPLYYYRLHASNMILTSRPQQRGCLHVIRREHFGKPFWQPYTHPALALRSTLLPGRGVPGGVPLHVTLAPEVTGSAFPAAITLTVTLPPGVEFLNWACDAAEARLTVGGTLVAAITYPVPDGEAVRRPPLVTLTLIQRAPEPTPLTVRLAWEDRFEGAHHHKETLALPPQVIPAPYQAQLDDAPFQAIAGQFAPCEPVSLWAALPPDAARASVSLPSLEADATGTIYIDTRLAPQGLTALVAQGGIVGNQVVLLATTAESPAAPPARAQRSLARRIVGRLRGRR
jgi:glycosyltransferase involved in cell wall biosynthesis